MRLFPNCASAASPWPVTLCGVFCTARGSASKKPLFASAQDRPDVARRRTLWKKIQLRLDPRRLVFSDATWAILRQAQDQYDAPTWLEQTRRGAHRQGAAGSLENDAIALRWDEITAPFVLDGPLNGEGFLAYVEQVLAPTLKRGDIVVMDNSPLARGVWRAPLGSPKRAAIRQKTVATSRGAHQRRRLADRHIASLGSALSAFPRRVPMPMPMERISMRHVRDDTKTLVAICRRFQ
jgi:hypothetical protein